jgi:hypothetical protein
MINTKKKFIAPSVTKVTNEPLMAAGVCNELFISTSTGGASNEGPGVFCYHYPVIRVVTGYTHVTLTHNDYNQPSICDVKLPPGCTFELPKQKGDWTEGKTSYSVTRLMDLGWNYYNDKCHFLGFIYLPDGTLISNYNIEQFKVNNY